MAILADRRYILLNPYNIQDKNIEILKQSDIMYENIDLASSTII